jgi:transcriptional regulator with XRE-family HTH domain
MGKNTLWQIEAGKVTGPRIDTLQALADVLEIPLSSLFTSDAEDEKGLFALDRKLYSISYAYKVPGVTGCSQPGAVARDSTTERLSTVVAVGGRSNTISGPV